MSRKKKRKKGGVVTDKPRRPFQSMLLPYEDQIRRWRKQRVTYREMAVLFKQDYGVDVHPDTINSFVLVRAKGRAVAELPEPSPRDDGALTQSPTTTPTKGARGAGRGKNPPDTVHSDQYPPARPDQL